MKTYDYDLDLGLMQLKKRKSRRKLLAGILLWCICIWGCFHWMYGISVIQGNSMRPSFHSGDLVLYKRGVPETLSYGDVLILQDWLDEKKHYVKRVQGVPGDVLEIDEKGYLVRNGLEIKEPEIMHGYQQPDSYVKFPFEVKDGTYFCLGDNRPVSLDSRVFGTVDKKQISGKVIALIRIGI